MPATEAPMMSRTMSATMPSKIDSRAFVKSNRPGRMT